MYISGDFSLDLLHFQTDYCTVCCQHILFLFSSSDDKTDAQHSAMLIDNTVYLQTTHGPFVRHATPRAT